MKVYSSDKIRNVVLLGHGGSGKTTLVEAMANATKLTSRQGRVEDGNTISDFDKEEIRRKFSIITSLIPIEDEDCKINILDTPGYFDFEGEVCQALSVADSALIVVSGKAGVEVGTEKAWEFATKMNIPKMIFVSGMDDPNADMAKVLQELKDKFGKSIAPLQVPIYIEEKFKGFVNVVKMKSRVFSKEGLKIGEIPEDMLESVEPVREMILEAVAETSEELLEKYFDGEEFTLDEIQNALRKGIIENNIVPVVCGNSVGQMGIGVLLHSLIKYLPSPLDVAKENIAIDSESQEEVKLSYDSDKKTVAYVFKTLADPYVGKLSLFKVLQGRIKPDKALYNVNKDESEKIGRIYTLRGKEQIELDALEAGDIGAFSKLNNVSTGDTLCEEGIRVKMPDIDFPESYAYRAIIPKSKTDEERKAAALSKLMEEDPTIKLVMDTENRQELLYGIGEQHLAIILSRLKNNYKVELDLIKPKIAYRETIKKKVEVRGRHKKQSGGHGQYGDVVIEFQPSFNNDVPYEFEEKIFGGAVPKNYFPAVEKGLQESVQKGVLAGYPVVGIKATLLDGSYHPVDSSEMAFKLATIIAFKEGMKQGNSVILEPIVKVKIVVPDDYAGDIMGDLNKRRGRILGMNPVDGKQEIEAEVPMGEMYGYSTDLRSMTQARGYYSLEFDRYEEAPHDVQEKVIEERAKSDK